ncbi:germ cell nuclear acidic protein [Drosophila nasuta]|uniref:germ cell nuclear acidic protein n=1 Tax=Drosophila nasuta TaxID=42062 RepID=UPI00295F5283|nr:germ cell nuclear acidic protein [Drosophila nasuta]XP_060646760.1 germ cell nuclear acidic protein [Drosophila nasuta]
MSNLLNMDKSNGNGVYATGSCHTDNAAATTALTTTTTSTSTANNINIMNGAAAVAAAAAAATLPTSASSEDLSQSLSEYTDADESISAPTEFLAEFLSAVMLKDYKKALKYCKLILQYEPNNGTAKEFYPLILDKLRVAASSDSDENYNKSSSPELALDLEQPCEDSVSSHSSSRNNCSDEDNDDEANDDDEEDDDDNDDDDDDVDVDEDDDVDIEDDDDIDVVDVEEEESSSGDDYELPIDEQQDVAAVQDGLAAHASHSHSHSHNDSGSSRNSSSGGGGGRSDNTTHSYSSLLLEEEDDIVPVNLQFGSKDASATDLDISNGNKVISASCSDSESPTEPLTQRLAAILRSKCGVSSRKAGDDNEPY